jgi:hypothetical protein
MGSGSTTPGAKPPIPVSSGCGSSRTSGERRGRRRGAAGQSGARRRVLPRRHGFEVRAGMQEFVYVSFADMAVDFPLQAAKRLVEERLMRSLLGSTILRPTNFLEVWLGPHLGFDPVGDRFGSSARARPASAGYRSSTSPGSPSPRSGTRPHETRSSALADPRRSVHSRWCGSSKRSSGGRSRSSRFPRRGSRRSWLRRPIGSRPRSRALRSRPRGAAWSRWNPRCASSRCA